MIGRICNEVLELLFPTDIYCISCGNLINRGKKYSLCDECITNIKWANENTCERCGVILQNSELKICPVCMEEQHRFERAYTCMVYDDLAKEMIKKYKFHGKAYMAKSLAEIMIDKFSTMSCAVDLVMPVPIHPKKKKERGYNQAGLVAEEFAKRLDIRYTEDILLRKNYKGAMNKMGADKRRENIMGSYSITESEEKLKMIKDSSILLIDDVYTTGSTVNECARLLLSGGAESVNVLTLASGVGVARLQEA